MTKDKVVDIGMVLNIFLGIEYQVFFILTQIYHIVFLLMLDIAVLGPRQSEAEAPARVQTREEPLAHLVVEDGTNDLK